MADVLIKGMEMPNTCRRCIEMEIPIRCRVMKEEPVTAVMSGYDRPSDCPLVELPSHGDLIDRQTVLSYFETGYLMGADMDYEDINEIVRKVVPTILEASDGSDN